MLSGSQELQRGGGLSEDRAAYLRERLAVLKVTKMDQVVQMYLFQCMLNAFPDDEPEAWHSQVDDACRVLLLTAYLGADSVDVSVFEFFFRRCQPDDGWCLRTVECVRSALRDFIVQCKGSVVVFQPFYMDVFRRSLIVEKTVGASADDDENSGSFQELFNMVKHDSAQSSHLRLRISKKKYSRLFYKYEVAFSDVRELVNSGRQMLHDLEQAAGAVPFGVWHALLANAMQGESCSCIAFIVRVLVGKYPGKAQILPRLCSAACAAFESALSYRLTRGGESGVWCFEVDQAIQELSSAVYISVFRSGLSPVLWNKNLPSIVSFMSKHAGDDSALNVIQFSKWLNVITGNSNVDDKERALERLMETGLHPNVDLWRNVIAGYSSGTDRERVVKRMVAAGVQPDALTWRSVLAGKYMSGADRERVLERMVETMRRERAVERMVGTMSFDAFAGHSSGNEEERALERMAALGVQPNEHAWTNLIAGLSSNADKESALEQIIGVDVLPDAITCRRVIRAMSGGAAKERVFHLLVSSGVQPDAKMIKRVIAGYSIGERQSAFERIMATGLTLLDATTLRKLESTFCFSFSPSGVDFRRALEKLDKIEKLEKSFPKMYRFEPLPVPLTLPEESEEFLKEARSIDLLIAVFQRHASPARMKDRMSELGHPIEF
jgi:hypothetical protein